MGCERLQDLQQTHINANQNDGFSNAGVSKQIGGASILRGAIANPFSFRVALKASFSIPVGSMGPGTSESAMNGWL